MNRKKLKIEVTAEERQLVILIDFLRNVQRCGNLGASRTLKLWVDGDGSAHLKFNFPEITELPDLIRFDDIEKVEKEKRFTWYLD